MGFYRCRLSYAAYILQELEKHNADNPGLKINILYDIACMLVKHLQVTIHLCKYVIYLDLYRNLHERWSSCTDPNQLSVQLNQMKKWVKYIFIMISSKKMELPDGGSQMTSNM